MKKSTFALLMTLIMVLFSFNLAIGEENQALTKISVSANSTIYVEPDNAKIIIGVTSNNKLVKIAQEETINKINTIIPAILNLGIEKENVITSNFNVSPVYDYSSNSTNGNTIQSYNVEYSLEISTNDITLISSVIDESIKNGANSSFGLQFQIKNSDKVYLEALEKAVKAAREKADIIASASGVKIIKVLSIDENWSNNNNIMYTKSYTNQELFDSASSTPILSGKISISAAVNITFEAK